MNSRRLRRLGLGVEQRQRLGALAVAALLVALIPLCLTLRLDARADREMLETNESVYYLPGRQWLVPLSLGYREAAAGLVWVRLLVYFGEQFELRGRFEYLEPYLWSVVELDPYFYRVYTWGSVSPLYNGTLITRHDVDTSIRLLEEGLRHFPDDGTLHYYLGFQYYYELAPIVSGPERERARRIGMDELCTAAMLGGGPPYLPLVCSRLEERHGMADAAAEQLAAILPTVEDERTRTRIEAHIERLLASPDRAFRILQRIDRFRERWQSEMPYAPAAFYAIAGPVPPVPLSDEYDMPTPLDAMIEAETEDLFYEGTEVEVPYESPTSEASPEYRQTHRFGPSPMEERGRLPRDEPSSEQADGIN